MAVVIIGVEIRLLFFGLLWLCKAVRRIPLIYFENYDGTNVVSFTTTFLTTESAHQDISLCMVELSEVISELSEV
jgi:hypothetical protein